MMRRDGTASLAALLALLSLLAGGTAACTRVQPPRTAPPVQAAPEPAPPAPAPPAPGEREMEGVRAALAAGKMDRASDLLKFVIALGAAAPARPEALYTLALLRARPDAEGRDPVEARRLLEEVIGSPPTPLRLIEARSILALLVAEQESRDSIGELRARLAVSEADSERIRITLAHREEELRRIKEILLGQTGGD